MQSSIRQKAARLRSLISKNKQGIYLSLKDSGIGIPTQDQRRIFDKGFTGENGRKK